MSKIHLSQDYSVPEFDRVLRTRDVYESMTSVYIVIKDKARVESKPLGMKMSVHIPRKYAGMFCICVHT